MRTVDNSYFIGPIKEQLYKRWFALWELTKRELKRKYARSYLGILWSVFYPLLRMVLVVFMFSFFFSKGIDRYPAYYFVGFLLYEFFATATTTALTCLRDNRDFLLKTKLPRELLVLSRVLTSFVNMMLGTIPFIIVLTIYRAPIKLDILWIPVYLFFFMMMVTGWSFVLAIIYPIFPDIWNIHENVIFILRFFVAMFYSIEWVGEKAQVFINNNPVYIYIKIVRDIVVYGNKPEEVYVIRGLLWGTLLYLFGKLFFRLFEQKVMRKI